MKHTGLLGLTVALLLVVGCESPELVTCRQDRQMLEQQTETLQKELNQARATIERKDAEIAKIRTENIEIQQQAMESIMTMLGREQERATRLQTALNEKEKALKAEQEKTAALQQLIDSAPASQDIESILLPERRPAL